MKTKKTPPSPGTLPADQAIANAIRTLASFNR